MCCKAMNAQCMACEKRMTVEDFCLIRGNEHIQGCERKDIIIYSFLANNHNTLDYEYETKCISFNSL